jgi:hypothetical protein
VLVAPHGSGHVVIGQPSHGWMCAQLGRAWGNELFGPVEPREEVCLAAEQHDTTWATWEAAPTLDPATGLPHTFESVDFRVNLELHTVGPRRLLTQSRYAALLVSLHHSSFFHAPSRVGRLREGGRRIDEFLAQAAGFQAELRATLDATDEEVDRNWRLVRTWDGLSHDLLLDQTPRTRRRVPAANGTSLDVEVGRAGGAFTLAPWPFSADRVIVRTEGRVLEQTFTDEAQMREALAAAPWVGLEYELRPG